MIQLIGFQLVLIASRLFIGDTTGYGMVTMYVTSAVIFMAAALQALEGARDAR